MNSFNDTRTKFYIFLNLIKFHNYFVENGMFFVDWVEAGHFFNSEKLLDVYIINIVLKWLSNFDWPCEQTFESKIYLNICILKISFIYYFHF